MWQSSNGSVSAPIIASTTTPSCIRWPQRMPGSQYWPRLIDSEPPATATSQSPSLIACAADTIACSPVPHSRFSVNAGVSTPSPPLTPATRARYMSRTSVWITLPNITWPTSDGSTPARLTASRTTVEARSQGGTAARPPPYLPIGVRVPDSTKTSRPLSIAPPVGDRRSPAGDRRSHVHAAVDGPDLPGDVRGLVGGQEADHPGDLFRLPEPAQRNLAADPVHHLVGNGGHHVGGDVAGGDRVHGQPDAVTGRALRPVELEHRLLGQRLGQPEQPGFGGGVVRLADVAGLADHRGHVDDPPGAAPEHVLKRVLGQEERTGQVDRDDPLPVVVGHLGHGPVDGDPGVVDQDVEPAMLVNDLADHPAAVIGVPDVPLVQGDGAAGVAVRHGGKELPGALLMPPVAGCDIGALAGQEVADGGPDAARAAGHQRHAAVDGAHPGWLALLMIDHCPVLPS